jgi:hypothetical protein
MTKLIVEIRGGTIQSIVKSVLDGDVQVFVLDYDDLDAGSPPDNALNPYPITHVILPDVTTLLVKNLRDYQPGKGKGKHNGN